MKKIRFCLKAILITAFFAILVGDVLAAPPMLINYQGRLRQSGQPVSGNKTMTFMLFTVPTAGSNVWQSGDVTVSVSTGIFSYQLGATGGLANIDWSAGAMYLEIYVDGQKLSPRERLVATPYAFYASSATVAIGVKGGGAGQLPYQSAANTTAMLAAGNSGDVLQSGGAGAPSWIQATNTNIGSTIVKRDGSGNFAGNTITATAFSGGNVSNWDNAYTHSQDNSQAHSDYLLNNADDTTSGKLTVTGAPTAATAAGSSLYTNPASATANYGLLGLSVGGVEQFRVDAEGNIFIGGTQKDANWDNAYSHKTTEDAINGIVKVNGAGGYSAVTDNSTNWNSAYSHKTTEDGLSGLVKVDGAGGYSAITDNSTNWESAYTHSQDNSQAHSDYLVNNADDSTSGKLTITKAPTAATAAGASVYINPGAATANYGLLGLAVNTAEVFRVDAEGNIFIGGTQKDSNWDTAYTHSQDNTQAHSDYLVNNADDTTSGQLTITKAPTAATAAGSSIYINPAAATADYGLLGLSVNSVEKFRVDAEGDIFIGGTQKNTNWDTAYTHSQDNSQAHSDYLVNNASDSTSGTLTINGMAITGGGTSGSLKVSYTATAPAGFYAVYAP